MRFLTIFALALVACASDLTFDHPSTELPPTSAPGVAISSKLGVRLGADRGVDDAGAEAFVLGDKTLRALGTDDVSMRRLLDWSTSGCPWTPRGGAMPDALVGARTRLAATAGGRAYLVNDLCGAWSVSLADPSQVAPVMSSATRPIEHLTFSDDARYLCVTDPAESERYVELWSLAPDGTPVSRLARRRGAICEELASYHDVVFAVIDGALLHFEGNELRPIGGIDKPSRLQLGASAAYFFDRNGLERLPYGASAFELVAACDSDCPAALVAGRTLYLARKVQGAPGSEIVARDEGGSFEERPIYRTADHESIFVPAGLTRTTSASDDDVWFMLEWRTAAGADPSAFYVAHATTRK